MVAPVYGFCSAHASSCTVGRFVYSRGMSIDTVFPQYEYACVCGGPGADGMCDHMQGMCTRTAVRLYVHACVVVGDTSVGKSCYNPQRYTCTVFLRYVTDDVEQDKSLVQMHVYTRGMYTGMVVLPCGCADVVSAHFWSRETGYTLSWYREFVAYQVLFVRRWYKSRLYYIHGK